MRVLVISVVICALGVVAHADDAARARQLFDAGRELLKSEHFAEACDKFAASLELDPATGTQLNLAECLTHLGEDARAKSLFEAAAIADEAAGNPKRAAFARARAADEAKKLAQTPVIAPHVEPSPPPPPIVPRETRRRRSRIYLALGLGAGAVGALVLGGAFSSASSDEYNQQIDSGACVETGAGSVACTTDGAAHLEHSRANGDRAETFAISGAVLGIAALVTWLTAPLDPIVPISVVVDRTSVGFAIVTRF